MAFILEKVLEDLDHRLSNHLPFQDPLEDAKQHYGMNTRLLETIVDHWKTKYNWRERENFLNQYPHFKTKIQGLDIHFVHVKPKETKGLKVVPLLLVHGWPGSFREFLETIPMLTTPQLGRNFVFEVVVPSLPGYGFSDAAVRPGMNPSAIAVIFKNLMARLGFNRYYIQGGDWGSMIVHVMSVLYPDRILGVHQNMCFVNTPIANMKMFMASVYPSLFMKQEHVNLIYPLSKMYSYILLESGYLHLQATKPDTVGVALRDSPVGLAAYILEKFTTWTNKEWKDLEDGGLTKKYTLTNLLDNVMIYWVNRSITTSMRLYSEAFSSDYYNQQWDRQPIKDVPSGCLRAEHEIAFSPDFILEEKYENLVHLKDYDNVGHFAAFQEPELFSKDVYDFVDKVEKLPKEKKK
ncbi:unnamed protein product [Acanthoscelides obtectus]|uniref:Epoxide hydrolase n=1 Tax=Acanthoscelides obtectus TaxID=200917 RepID=A0A9P0LUX2_ACAOB|nr:unnamed protein product [Acanthoscelides obtectus]CAK1652733.1 Juvenile hormone epoxide hydrolase 1 [Acanthoscelides obtectus]